MQDQFEHKKLTSNICDILSCIHPQTIVSIPTSCTRVTAIVNFSVASDKAAIKKSEVRIMKIVKVEFLLYIHAKQLR